MDVALVIAANSFVGGHLCNRLGKAQVRFRTTTRTPQSGSITCDLTGPGPINALLAKVHPRWLFCCAGGSAQTSVGELHALHVAGTEALLEAASRHVPDAVTI